MVLQRDSNWGPSKGLAKMLAFWFLVLMNSSHATFSSTISRMKSYRISICFDFECWTRFLDKSMALVLSQKQFGVMDEQEAKLSVIIDC